MTFPVPQPGLVIRYSYLWRSAYLDGAEEGVKDRPAAIILVVREGEGSPTVTVLPITHAQPDDPRTAVEIPQPVKARLGLDSERSWVVLNEANRFRWPGPDLRPIPGRDVSTTAYGFLPPRFFETLRQRFVEALAARRAKVVPRTE